jgi:hypothetical protein
MPDTPADIETALTLLAATPRLFATPSRGLDNARLQSKPGTDAWSANEILAHLRACADVESSEACGLVTRGDRYRDDAGARTDSIVLHNRAQRTAGCAARHRTEALSRRPITLSWRLEL